MYYQSIEEKKGIRQAFRDDLQDGLSELALGAILLLVGLYLVLMGVQQWLANWSFLLAYALIISFQAAIQRLKKRFVYPLTGVSQSDEVKEMRQELGCTGLALLPLVFIVGLPLLLLAMALWPEQVSLDNGFLFFFGLWLGSSYILQGRYAGLRRYYVYAACMLLWGVASAVFLPYPYNLYRNALGLAAIGALMIVWGGAIFVRFLKAHPAPVL